jgi:hypothetical protein
MLTDLAYEQTKLMGGAAEDAQDSYAAAGAIANEAITSVRTVAAFSNEEYEVKRYAFHLRAAMTFGIPLIFTLRFFHHPFHFISFHCYLLNNCIGIKKNLYSGATLGLTM